MSSAKKNILLVGGSGYLGSHLRKELSSHTVFFTSASGKENTIVLDLLKKETYKNIKAHSYDHIILLASSLKGLGTTILKEEYLDVDTKGLPAFLQYIADNKLTEKLVYISSMTVYGTENKFPATENATLNPLSTYGLSKVLAENIFGFFCTANDLKGAILRIPGIYGGNRTSGYIYNAVVKCKSNLPVEIDTAGLGYWETIHISDLCSALARFIDKYDWKEKTDTFNISYGRKTDIVECAFLIKELTGSVSEINIKNKDGYVGLYLDNSKVKQIISLPDNYKTSLENYIKNIPS